MAEHYLKLINEGDNYTYQELHAPLVEPNKSDYAKKSEYKKAYDDYTEKIDEWAIDNDIYIFDDECDKWKNIILLLYKGNSDTKPKHISYIHTWAELEYEFEKNVIKELKKNHHFVDMEYGENSFDDSKTEWIVIIPKIERLKK